MQNLKKEIIYRSNYRGTKEADFIISNFIKKYIDDFDIQELRTINLLLKMDDTDFFAELDKNNGSSKNIAVKFNEFKKSLYS